jgi:hypothetical protein
MEPHAEGTPARVAAVRTALDRLLQLWAAEVARRLASPERAPGAATSDQSPTPSGRD